MPSSIRTLLGFFLAVLAIVATRDAVSAAQPAVLDRIYVNGRVWTGESDDSFAQAFAVAGNRIVAVGDDATLISRAHSSTPRVDLHGRLVVPGFIDNHTHFLSTVIDGEERYAAVSH